MAELDFDASEFPAFKRWLVFTRNLLSLKTKCCILMLIIKN
jgi:hypothetical protein